MQFVIVKSCGTSGLHTKGMPALMRLVRSSTERSRLMNQCLACTGLMPSSTVGGSPSKPGCHRPTNATFLRIPHRRTRTAMQTTWHRTSNDTGSDCRRKRNGNTSAEVEPIRCSRSATILKFWTITPGTRTTLKNGRTPWDGNVPTHAGSSTSMATCTNGATIGLRVTRREHPNRPNVSSGAAVMIIQCRPAGRPIATESNLTPGTHSSAFVWP